MDMKVSKDARTPEEFRKYAKRMSKYFDLRGCRTEKCARARNYLQWARDNLQFLKNRDWPRLSVDNMRGLLIIGKKSDLNNIQKKRLQAMNHDVRATYQIKTFDDLTSENKTALENISRRHS